MINAIRDHDILNAKKDDFKIMPICFSSFEIFIEKLVQSHKDEYPKNSILGIFDEYLNYLDDERILRILHNKLFSDEEKREFEGKENRFKRISFPKFQEYINNNKNAIIELFKLIREDKDLKGAKVFTDTDL